MNRITNKSRGDAITAEDFNSLVSEVRRLGSVSTDAFIGHRDTQAGQQFYLTNAPTTFRYIKLTAAWNVLLPNMLTGNPCTATGAGAATNKVNIAIMSPMNGGNGSVAYNLGTNDTVAYFPMSPTNTQGTNVIVGVCTLQKETTGTTFAVTCASNSGSFGDSSNRATLTYNITPTWGGGTIGANLVPGASAARIVACTVTPGTNGIAYFSGLGGIRLAWVSEVADSDQCS